MAWIFALGALGCAQTAAEHSPLPAADPPAALVETATLELVETAPIGTVLDDPELRETWVVWLEMIDRAERSIDLLHFYASTRPGDPLAGGCRLEPVVQALERAAERGVRVRFVADAGFHATYPDTLDRLDARDRIEVRLYDLRARTGGVQHAKAMIVDEREVFLGSQNFDWRALEHIQELGVRIESRALARWYGDVFELDWQWAGAAPVAAAGMGHAADELPVEPRIRLEDFPQVARVEGAGGGAEAAVLVWPAASPTGALPDEDGWDLPRLVAWIDAAESDVCVQLLSYKTVGRDGAYFPTLDNALRAAAARGVRVRLLLADWSKRSGTIEALVSLAVLPGVEVRLATIPQAAEGFIPFARVIHAKLLVVDGRRAWLGTSNWDSGYFTASRNLGLFVEGAAFAERLMAFFDRGWDAPYAEDLEPGRAYVAPRIAE